MNKTIWLGKETVSSSDLEDSLLAFLIQDCNSDDWRSKKRRYHKELHMRSSGFLRTDPVNQYILVISQTIK